MRAAERALGRIRVLTDKKALECAPRGAQWTQSLAHPTSGAVLRWVERNEGGGLMAEKDLAARSVVLFDFDGTLADSVGAIVSTARTALLANGFPEEELGDLTRLVGPPLPRALLTRLRPLGGGGGARHGHLSLHLPQDRPRRLAAL